MRRLSPVVFSIVYCVCYVMGLALNAPLFTFYPQNSQFSWGWQALEGVGPEMAWYGLVANAAIAGIIVGLAVREDPVVRLLRNFLWLFPFGAMVACVYLMRPFFLG